MKIIIFSSILVLLYSCSGQQPPAPVAELPSVPVMQVATAAASMEYPASIEGMVNVDIRPQIDGYLQKLFVDEGVYGTTSEPLFKIDDDLSLKKIALQIRNPI